MTTPSNPSSPSGHHASPPSPLSTTLGALARIGAAAELPAPLLEDLTDLALTAEASPSMALEQATRLLGVYREARILSPAVTSVGLEARGHLALTLDLLVRMAAALGAEGSREGSGGQG